MKEENIDNIVDYWNKALLCSWESSTSKADTNMAYLDNEIENIILRRMLDELIKGKCTRCLDVGAGYGRFTRTFQKYFSEVILLEAADSIYKQLQSYWISSPEIKCRQGTFEAYQDDKKYDLIFASGVLYLYNDEMLERFIAKTREMLCPSGFIILRDFISNQPMVTESTFIKNGYCYYRSPQFWRDTFSDRGIDVVAIKPSKPRLGLLRDSNILKILRSLHLARHLQNALVIRLAITCGDWRMKGSDLKTVFIVAHAA